MARSPDMPREGNLIDTIKNLRRPKRHTDDGWVQVNDATDEISPGFETAGWDHAGGATAPASFYIDPNGEVRFRGNITGGTVGTVIFVLPEGFRPEYKEYFNVINVGIGAAEISVDPNGNVTLERLI